MSERPDRTMSAAIPMVADMLRQGEYAAVIALIGNMKDVGDEGKATRLVAAALSLLTGDENARARVGLARAIVSKDA